MPTQLQNDPELMSRFREGDPLAFQQVHQLYYQRICYFASGMVHSVEDAKDIVGDVFVKLWSRHKHFESLQNVQAFLYITARNDCIKYLQNLQRKETTSRVLSNNSGQENPLVQMEKTEFLAKVYKQIKSLPDSQRNVLEMFLEGLSTVQIAQKLQCKESQVRKIKYRALNQIREQLEKNKYLSVACTLFLSVHL